jgi:fructoselysine-6-P-deglycase FrlB-like protein
LGRPYRLELEKLDATYQWARRVDISGLAMVINRPTREPLLAIGSGGSLSTACLIATLEQRVRGCFSNFDTPFLATGNPEFVAGSRVFIVSARGRNPDVLGFARFARAAEPVSLISMCCMQGSPLTEVVDSFHRGNGFEFDSPAGKDGYLATNSLVALNTVIARAYGAGHHLPQSWSDLFDTRSLKRSLGSTRSDAGLIRSDRVLLLFGPGTRPSAVDFESKFHESGLASVQVTDYRNFAHGRHLWLAQHPDTTVIAFISPNDRVIAEATLKLLPKAIRTLRVETSHEGIAAAFAMQAAVFELVSICGEDRGRDPGRPTVPMFGRKLYHLNKFPALSRDLSSAAVARKSRARRIAGLPDLSKAEWEAAYHDFRRQLTALRFKQCVLDYDGTVCDHRDRFDGIGAEVTKALLDLLEGGFPLGIATGRGKSVREALCAALPKHLWPLVIVAFYNGAIVSPLSDQNSLTEGQTQVPVLSEAARIVREASVPGVKITERPFQITLEWAESGTAEPLWYHASALLARAGMMKVRIVASSRSVDIIEAATSKLNVLKKMPGAGPAQVNTLFIGDRPSWPGNDFELLAQPGSLSVEEVGCDLETGWNLAPAGVTGSAALVHYLGQIRKSSQHFRLALRKS